MIFTGVDIACMSALLAGCIRNFFGRTAGDSALLCPTISYKRSRVETPTGLQYPFSVGCKPIREVG